MLSADIFPIEKNNRRIKTKIIFFILLFLFNLIPYELIIRNGCDKNGRIFFKLKFTLDISYLAL